MAKDAEDFVAVIAIAKEFAQTDTQDPEYGQMIFDTCEQAFDILKMDKEAATNLLSKVNESDGAQAGLDQKWDELQSSENAS